MDESRELRDQKVMSKRKNVHVVARNDGWIIRKEGNSRATSLHKTQRDAVKAAREIARSNNVELVIHGRDGRIRERDSYGSDPLPPRDRQVLFPDASASTSDRAIKSAVAEVMRESKADSKNRSRSASGS
jgi:Uncharacterized protein conserved in bacteria (DUF2188)